MERHKSLYKDNFLFPKNSRVHERNAIRAQDRIDGFNLRRNILLTPPEPNIPVEVSEANKENEINAEGMNPENNQLQTETKEENGPYSSTLSRIICKSNGPVLSRREKYLQRFIEWRQSTKKQDGPGKSKEMHKPPFVPAGSIKYSGTAVDHRTKSSTKSIVTKDHNVKAPEGLKNSVSALGSTQLSDKKRQSLYTIATNPQKKNSKLEVVKNLPTVRRAVPLTGAASMHTTPMITTHHSKVVNHPLSKPLATATKTIKNRAVITNGVTATTSGKPETRSITKPRKLELPQRQSQRPVPNPQPSSRVKDVKSKVTKTKRIERSTRIEDLKQNGAVGKTKATAISKRPDPLPKSKPSLAVSMKAKRINPSLSSRPIGGAIKKQTTKVKTNKLQLLQGACEQICLAVETPRDQFSPTNAFGTFVTSTQRKSQSSSQNTLEFLTLDTNVLDSISPVEPVVLSRRDSTVKRQQTDLKLEEEVPNNQNGSANKPKKKIFNFVRYNDSPAKPEGKERNLKANEKLDTTAGHIKEDTITLNESVKTDIKRDPEENPVYYLSPYVSVARGKVNSRTEKEKRNSLYLQSDGEILESEKYKEGDPIVLRRTLETVRYFRKQLTDEIQRLHGICKLWETYKLENSSRLQETGGDDMINVAIGQTKLLTSKKFEQFSGLIDRCEKGLFASATLVNDGSEDTKPITTEDLEGFWSMLGLQTDNIDKRFANLERWRKNNWIDPDILKEQAVKVRKAKRISEHKAISNNKAKPNSNLQQFIRKMHAELRKKQTMATANDDRNIGDNDVILMSSRKRRSGEKASPQPCRRDSRRVSIIVRDRKLHSAAPTILTITTPKRRSSQTSRLNTPESWDTPKLFNHMQEFKHSLTNLEKSGDECLSAFKKSEFTERPFIVRTPSPCLQNTPMVKGNVRKSILKTPGTVRGQPKNVNFNEKLKIKKYKFTIDSDQSDVDELESVGHDNLLAVDSDNGDKRTYGLRTRTVVLRRSSEIEIPK